MGAASLLGGGSLQVFASKNFCCMQTSEENRENPN